MRSLAKSSNKSVNTVAIDSASLAHGYAVLCANAASLLRRFPWRYASQHGTSNEWASD